MKWKEIGKVSVDSGMVMITDPCRVVSHPEGTAPQFSSLFKNWKEFVRAVDVSRPGIIPFPSNGLPEMAVVSATGVGDGSFPVMALIDATVPGSGIVELRIVFDEKASIPEDFVEDGAKRVERYLAAARRITGMDDGADVVKVARMIQREVEYE